MARMRAGKVAAALGATVTLSFAAAPVMYSPAFAEDLVPVQVTDEATGNEIVGAVYNVRLADSGGRTVRTGTNVNEDDKLNLRISWYLSQTPQANDYFTYKIPEVISYGREANLRMMNDDGVHYADATLSEDGLLTVVFNDNVRRANVSGGTISMNPPVRHELIQNVEPVEIALPGQDPVVINYIARPYEYLDGGEVAASGVITGQELAWDVEIPAANRVMTNSTIELTPSNSNWEFDVEAISALGAIDGYQVVSVEPGKLVLKADRVEANSAVSLTRIPGVVVGDVDDVPAGLNVTVGGDQAEIAGNAEVIAKRGPESTDEETTSEETSSTEEPTSSESTSTTAVEPTEEETSSAEEPTSTTAEESTEEETSTIEEPTSTQSTSTSEVEPTEEVTTSSEEPTSAPVVEPTVTSEIPSTTVESVVPGEPTEVVVTTEATTEATVTTGVPVTSTVPTTVLIPTEVAVTTVESIPVDTSTTQVTTQVIPSTTQVPVTTEATVTSVVPTTAVVPTEVPVTTVVTTTPQVTRTTIVEDIPESRPFDISDLEDRSPSAEDIAAREAEEAARQAAEDEAEAQSRQVSPLIQPDRSEDSAAPDVAESVQVPAVPQVPRTPAQGETTAPSGESVEDFIAPDPESPADSADNEASDNASIVTAESANQAGQRVSLGNSGASSRGSLPIQRDIQRALERNQSNDEVPAADSESADNASERNENLSAGMPQGETHSLRAAEKDGISIPVTDILLNGLAGLIIVAGIAALFSIRKP